jgi:O-antigen/teichoic acid export membrane protein
MKKILQKIPGYSYFGQAITTSTFKQSSITFGGTVINGIFGAIFYIVTARFLGPVGFGLMSVAITIQTLVADIGDLGTDTGLVNFVSRNLKNDPEKANKFLKLALKVKLFISFIALILGLISSAYLAKYAFGKPELAVPLKIAFVGVGTLLVFSFITKSLQAMQRFWAWSNIQVVISILRLIFVFIFLAFGILNLSTSLWLYVLMPLVGFVIGIFVIKTDFLKVKNEMEVRDEFFNYNKWVAGFLVLAAFGGRVDTFMSARFLSAYDLGLYAAAYQLVRIVPQIVSAIGTVIAPKMAEFGSLRDLKIYLKKTQVMVLVLAILGILTIPLVLYIIPVLFGRGYEGTGPIFIVLFVAMLIFLISVPVHMAIFYYFSKPSFFFWLSLGHLILITTLSYLLLNSLGVIGAAWAVLAGQFFSFIIPFVWVVREVYKEERL